MIKAIRHQIKFALQQNATIITFYVLLSIVLLNFVENVLCFQGWDVVEMYHPAKLLALSYNRIYFHADITLLLVQIYPFLVVCPAGFILISEKSRNADYLLITRIGSTKYYLSQIITGFFVTMIIFTVPFLIELFLNYLSFPVDATGDFTNLSQYDPIYIEMTEHYIFSELFNLNPFLYALFGILLFGFFSGIMGMITIALSAVITFRYKVFLFLPVFIFLNATLYVPEIFGKLPFSVRWYDYLLIFDDNIKNSKYFIILMVLFLTASVTCSLIKGRGDQL